ncbi:MAG: hypothetical protein QW042_04995 [Thermoplasmata archaeon]
MYDTFFERQFSYLRDSSTIEEREKIIKYMVEEFTLHVLSKISYDDYVIPNYTRKILYNFDYEIIDIPDREYDHVKIIFPDFEIFFDDSIPIKVMERDLKQRIQKYSKVNAIVISDDEIDNLDKELKNIFVRSNPNKVVDVVVVNLDEPYLYLPGGELFIRDIKNPYLIHKYLCYDDDVYKVINETNRSITEFLAKFENEYNSSFFL